MESFVNSQYCDICGVKQQENKNIKHCKECNICIEGHDHHCFFLSRCIGKNNKYVFYLLFGLTFITYYNICIPLGYQIIKYFF